MPERTIPISKCDTTWLVQDAGAANSWAPLADVGDFGYAAPLYGLTRIRNRCTLYAVRGGDQEPVTTSATINITDLGSASYSTITGICEEKGYVAANWVSTTAATSDVPTFDQVVTIDGASFGIPDHVLTFPDMVLRGAFSTADVSTYAITGESATANKPTVS